MAQERGGGRMRLRTGTPDRSDSDSKRSDLKDYNDLISTSVRLNQYQKKNLIASTTTGQCSKNIMTRNK
jgi:hypothetical protein